MADDDLRTDDGDGDHDHADLVQVVKRSKILETTNPCNIELTGMDQDSTGLASTKAGSFPAITFCDAFVVFVVYCHH